MGFFDDFKATIIKQRMGFQCHSISLFQSLKKKDVFPLFYCLLCGNTVDEAMCTVLLVESVVDIWIYKETKPLPSQFNVDWENKWENSWLNEKKKGRCFKRCPHDAIVGLLFPSFLPDGQKILRGSSEVFSTLVTSSTLQEAKKMCDLTKKLRKRSTLRNLTKLIVICLACKLSGLRTSNEAAPFSLQRKISRAFFVLFLIFNVFSTVNHFSA